MKLSCGCTPDDSGFGYCSECVRKLRKKIWANMSRERRDYDRHVAPEQSQALDEELNEDNYNTGCSCHINPPCSYCISKGEEDE